jgi:hypothetical protein
MPSRLSKADPMDYKCLRCGSTNGEPIDNASENWYWRVVENGRVGPFCSQPCSREFRLTDEPMFSLLEWERLHFLKWRVMNGQLSDVKNLAS